MPKKNIDEHYLDVAQLVSELSYDRQIQVGCVIVKDGQILSQGYNGNPSGMDNITRDLDGITLPTVIHSEANALMKLARNGGGAKGSSLYCTHSPCYDCSKLIIQAGIRDIIYTSVYDKDAIEFLKENGVKVSKA